MTIGNITFTVKETSTRYGRWFYVLTRDSVEIERGIAYPSEFEAYMRGWIAALRWQKSAQTAAQTGD